MDASWYPPSSLPSSDTWRTQIDATTARNLELVVSMSAAGERVGRSAGPTLFSVMNRTVTKMGERLLRMNILCPVNDAQTLTTRYASWFSILHTHTHTYTHSHTRTHTHAHTQTPRHETVQDILDDELLFHDLRGALSSFRDIDHIISQLVQVPKNPSVKLAESGINLVILIKHAVQLTLPLKTCLREKHSPLLSTIYTSILSDDRIDEIAQAIEEAINPDVTLQKTPLGLRNQRVYAVKSGFNSLLDVARQTYKETIDHVYDYADSVLQRFQGLQAKVSFSEPRGFFFSLPQSTAAAATPEPPEEFVNFVRKGKAVTCTSLKLMSFNDRIQESLTEVYLMSDQTVTTLLDLIRGRVEVLYKLSEAVAMLDMLQGFAACVVSQDINGPMVCPEFTETLAIKQGRHPIREAMRGGGERPMVPNDAYAYAGSAMFIVHGINMSGKSTYLRQIALMCVMAQTGAFLPAEYASVRLCDRIFSRYGLPLCSVTMHTRTRGSHAHARTRGSKYARTLHTRKSLHAHTRKSIHAHTRESLHAYTRTHANLHMHTRTQDRQ